MFKICKSINVIQYIYRLNDRNHMTTLIYENGIFSKVYYLFMNKVLKELGLPIVYLKQ